MERIDSYIAFNAITSAVTTSMQSLTHETCLQECIAILKHSLENCSTFLKTCFMCDAMTLIQNHIDEIFFMFLII